ncbi:hypothetical protein KIN20_037974 [Parelaphostrongylus tenuis]|uniref:Uncharacterized protein n=1 Tax=Parelaphostrongylus tenuis TaxID=148309 RepID=A0AAD5WM89_PARTN|nr:hypothetical protein KIN20_037974 [Parelaphostrongylus tenuis]
MDMARYVIPTVAISVACPEEDLACSDEWFTRRPSQVWRLLQLLRFLFLKTESPFNPSMIGEWLPLLASLVNHGISLEERLLSHKICQNALNTLGVVNYQLRSDIYELFLPDKEPVVDLILIHGLCGSVAYTWRQKDHASNIVSDCWPKDWLLLDISEPMRILGLDYPSYIMQFTGAIESLQVREARRVGQTIQRCHARGWRYRGGSTVPNGSVCLFIATPHRGSPIASWGYSVFHPTADVLFLLEENPLNRKLNEEFSSISDKIPVIVSMAETKESDLIGRAKGLIVPTQSAVFEKGAVYHIEECKKAEKILMEYKYPGAVSSAGFNADICLWG